MKKAKRWLALILAITLLSSNALYQIGTSLSADETEDVAADTDGQEDAEEGEAAAQDAEDSGAADVTVVTDASADGESTDADKQTGETPADGTAAETQTEDKTGTTADTEKQEETAKTSAAAETASEEKEEISYPEFSYKGEEDGVGVTIFAEEGVFPEGTTVELAAASDEDRQAAAKAAGCDPSDLVGLDITFVYEGKEIEPKGDVQVSFSSEKIEQAGETGVVYHVKDNGDVESVDSSKDGDTVGFTADSFSTYLTLTASESDSDETAEGDGAESTGETENIQEFFVAAKNASIEVGSTTTMSVTILPETIENKEVTWSSSDSSIATVTENGTVTGVAEGAVKIKGVSKCDNTAYDTARIVVTPVMVKKVTISTSNNANLTKLIKSNTVQLTAEATPDTAADRTVTWSSSKESVAKVDENGNVTAVGQGTATIRAYNDASGKYDEVTVTVYNEEPVPVSVHVWVTNNNQNVEYNFNLPKDGTEVSPSEVYKNLSSNQYVSTGEIRVENWEKNETWSNIKKGATVKSFRYNNNKIQYTTDGSSWKSVDGNDIIDFCSLLRSGDSTSSTDVKVTIGDWPYDSTNQYYDNNNKNTITIKVIDEEHDNEEVYNSGSMHYDNGQTSCLGKIKFNCDTSRYEVDHVDVYYSSNSGSEETELNQSSGKYKADSDGYSVQFSKQQSYGSPENHYTVKAYIKAKEFTVSYDAGEGASNVPGSTKSKAIDDIEAVVSTQQPTKEGFIFAGWEYDGTTYYGGDSFEMPAHDVTLVAKWVTPSQAINYKVSDPNAGSVSSTYERYREGNTIIGSRATANQGYVFQCWKDADGKEVSTNAQCVPSASGTYTAYFTEKKVTVRYVAKEGGSVQVTGEDENRTEETFNPFKETPDTLKGATATAKQGYTFVGWYSDEACTTKVSETAAFTPTNVTWVSDRTYTYYAKFKAKEGKVGYYLALDGATWSGFADEGLIQKGTSGNVSLKYYYNYGFAKGDTFIVTSKVPTADGYAFIGWLDKERGSQSAAIREAGAKVTYCYSGEDTYTLDALWAKLDVEGYDGKYDGSNHTIKNVSVVINDYSNLKDTYKQQAQDKISVVNNTLKYSKDGESWSEEKPAFKDAGTYTVYVQQKVKVGKTEYTLKGQATVEIKKRSIIMTSATDSKVYDGTPLTNQTITVTDDGFVEGEGAVYNVTGSQTVVGSSNNEFTYTLNGKTKEKNYNITTAKGTLTVTERDDSEKYTITVTAKSGEATYDGNEHMVTGFESVTGTNVTQNRENEDLKFTLNEATFTVEGLSASVSGTDADTYTNSVEGTAIVKDENGNDVTSQFKIKTVNGTLTIQKRSITIKAGNAEKEYDGTPLTCATTTITSNTELAEGNRYTATTQGSQTAVGESNNVIESGSVKITQVVNGETKDVTSNYNVSTQTGKLKVTNRTEKYSITITAASAEFTYDGNAHNVSGITNESKSFTDESSGAAFTISVAEESGDQVTQTDVKREEDETVGFYNHSVSQNNIIIKDSEGNVVTDQFAITMVSGSLTIKPVPLILQAGSGTWVYDGSEHKLAKYQRLQKEGESDLTDVVDGDAIKTVTVSGQQTLVGSSDNVITSVEITKADGTTDSTGNYEITKKAGTLTVIDKHVDPDNPDSPDVDPNKVITKTHDTDKTYKLGETIAFTVTVKNIYAEQKEVTITETDDSAYFLGKDEQKVTSLTKELGTGSPDNTWTVTAYHVVTEQDIIAGTYTNKVQAAFAGSEGNKTFENEDTVKEFTANPELTITKTANAYRGQDGNTQENHVYNLGETVNYTITAENTGNVTLTNVTVKDEKTNAEWTKNNQDQSITLAPGERVSFTTSHKVTEEDVKAGTYVNTATGSASSPDGVNNPTVKKGEETVPVETPSPSMTVKKEVINTDENGNPKTSGYQSGEKITYKITVTNNGNVTLTGVTLSDNKTGDTNPTVAEKILPGNSAEYTTSAYTVTEKDLLASKVKNTVNVEATASTPTKENPSKTTTVEGTDTCTVNTVSANPSLSVKKTVTSNDGDEEHVYKLGDTINYQITVKNNGNLTLTGVELKDELTGLENKVGTQPLLSDTYTLAPGEKQTFETSYTVQEKDLGSVIKNVATATGKVKEDTSKEAKGEGEAKSKTEERTPKLEITKSIVSPKALYEIGDTIQYNITIRNTGNLTQKDIVVKDQLQNAAGGIVIKSVTGDTTGTFEGAKVTLEELAPGEKATISAEYTVQKADNGKKILNGAVIEDSKGPNTDPQKPGDKTDKPETPDKSNKTSTEVEKLYRITVEYKFADGNEPEDSTSVSLPASTTIEDLKTGTQKDLEAVEVVGYVAYPAKQSVTITDKDEIVTFLYYKDAIGTDPTDPDRLDGIPDEYQVVVRFTAANGKVSHDHAVVTLFGEDGETYAKDGVGHLAKEQIAAATANNGYNQNSLTWTPGTPTTDYDIKEAMTFHAAFTKNESSGGGGSSDSDPTPTPTPTPDATPDATPAVTPATPAGPIRTIVDNVVTPIVEAVKGKAAEIQEIMNSDDEDVPLANQKLDDHRCCILHFLLMLLALILGIFATNSMRRRQKKLQEVKEELDCELARRGLPVTGEQQ